jgi:hypothetical protein
MSVSNSEALVIDIEASVLSSFSGSWGTPTQLSGS